jgi:Lon-like ATP-dependent protease
VRKLYGGNKKSIDITVDGDDKEKEKDDKGAAVGTLTHTGRLGDVMRESVEVVKIAAFNFLTKNNLAKDFEKDNYHLHVP